jgi:hypothetical protein
MNTVLIFISKWERSNSVWCCIIRKGFFWLACKVRRLKTLLSSVSLSLLSHLIIQCAMFSDPYPVRSTGHPLGYIYTPKAIYIYIYIYIYTHTHQPPHRSMFTNSAISRKHCYQNSIDTVNSPPPKTLLLEQQRILRTVLWIVTHHMNSTAWYEQ